MASTLIRSRGVGQAQVVADLAPFRSGTLQIDFVWPLAFSLAALLGALLGSGADILRTTPENRRTLQHLVSGLIVGIIVAAAYAAGINLAPSTFALQTTVSEAAVFVFAALGGAFGLPWLKHLFSGESKPE